MKILLIAIIAALMGIACKKSYPLAESVCSVNVINAVVEGKRLKLNSMLNDSVNVYNSKVFGLMAGENTPVYLYPVRDSLSPYYSKVLSLQSGHLYSLFLCGKPGAVDSLLVDDLAFGFNLDSTLGIRVINLATGSKSYSITQASDTARAFFSDLTYKSLTGFSRISLRKPIDVKAVTFQVRNAGGKVLASYSLPENPSPLYRDVSILNARGRNLTLIIRGEENTPLAENAIGLFPVANY